MKIHQVVSTTLVVLICSLSMGAFATVRAWTGAGDNDNFSTPANWSDGVAPATGDILVFMGKTRTSPVNDLDPEVYSFAGIVFSNTTSTCNAPFTLSGKPLRVTGAASGVVPGVNQAFGIWTMKSSGGITDVLELDVVLVNNSPIGCHNGGNHHLTFKGTVTGKGDGYLNAVSQYSGLLKFEGPLKNVLGVSRPNGGGTFWLTSPLNEFAGTSDHDICQGTLKVDSLAAYGGVNKGVKLGQRAWETPAYFEVNAGEDTHIAGPITIRAPGFNKLGGCIRSNVAGKRVTLSGDLTTVTAGNGSICRFEGVGDGVFSGRMVSTNTRLQKGGAGTWTFSGDSSCVSTESAAVEAGTLIIDADYSSLSKITVSSGATLGGTGCVSSVTFANNSTFCIHYDENGFSALEVKDSLVLDGTVKLSLDAMPTELEPQREYTLCTFADITGDGEFIGGDRVPSSAKLELRGNSLVMTLAAAELVWKGDAANNVWDTTAANWQGDRVFIANSGVTFDDSADAGTENVVIPSDVSPAAVKVNGSRNYTFTGAGIAGGGGG